MNIEMQCGSCSRITTLTKEAQTKMLARMVRPSQTETIECGCGHYQFVLAARKAGRRAA